MALMEGLYGENGKFSFCGYYSSQNLYSYTFIWALQHVCFYEQTEKFFQITINLTDTILHTYSFWSIYI